MNTTSTINLFGFINTNNQFEVKSTNINSKFNKNNFFNNTSEPDISEYFLLGFIAFIEAAAQKLAQEENLFFRSLQLEVVAKQFGQNVERKTRNFFFPFENIYIELLPSTQEKESDLQNWVNKIRQLINLPEEVVNIQLSGRIQQKNIA